MCGCMIGCEENEIAVTTYLLVEIGEQSRQLLVGSKINFLSLGSHCPKLMSYIVGGRETHRQHIRSLTPTQGISVDSGNGQICRERYPVGHIAHIRGAVMTG